MRVEKSIEITAPVEKIWPFLAEPEKILKWYIPLQKFEYTSAQHSGEGAPLYFEEKTSGQLMKLNCTVTEWVENERFAFKMTSGNMLKSYQEKWKVETTPFGSRFTFTEEGKLPYGVIGSLIEPLVQRGSANTVEKMLFRLKSLAEA